MITPKTTTMTIRLEPELKSRLGELSTVTRRTMSYLAAEAVREYIELNEWQIQEIKGALAEADAGDFADDQEVATAFNKWRTDAD